MKKTAFPRLAFSLIEMLVAMAVLAMLAVLVLQIINISTSVTSTSARKMEGLAGARFALDRIGFDLEARLKSAEAATSFQKKQGNDEFGFYSEVDAYSGDRRITAVEYRISGTGQNRSFQLERGVLGGEWDESFPSTFPSLANLQYETLAEGVLRMEFGYLLKSGQFTTDTTATNLNEVSAIVIGLAVLDTASRKMLTQDQLAQLVEILNDPSSANQKDLISKWEEAIQQAGLPSRAVQNIHFLQRYYYVR